MLLCKTYMCNPAMFLHSREPCDICFLFLVLFFFFFIAANHLSDLTMLLLLINDMCSSSFSNNAFMHECALYMPDKLMKYSRHVHFKLFSCDITFLFVFASTAQNENYLQASKSMAYFEKKKFYLYLFSCLSNECLCVPELFSWYTQYCARLFLSCSFYYKSCGIKAKQYYCSVGKKDNKMREVKPSVDGSTFVHLPNSLSFLFPFSERELGLAFHFFFFFWNHCSTIIQIYGCLYQKPAGINESFLVAFCIHFFFTVDINISFLPSFMAT